MRDDRDVTHKRFGAKTPFWLIFTIGVGPCEMDMILSSMLKHPLRCATPVHKRLHLCINLIRKASSRYDIA